MGGRDTFSLVLWEAEKPLDSSEVDRIILNVVNSANEVNVVSVVNVENATNV